MRETETEEENFIAHQSLQILPPPPRKRLNLQPLERPTTLPSCRYERVECRRYVAKALPETTKGAKRMELLEPYTPPAKCAQRSHCWIIWRAKCLKEERRGIRRRRRRRRSSLVNSGSCFPDLYHLRMSYRVVGTKKWKRAKREQTSALQGKWFGLYH